MATDRATGCLAVELERASNARPPIREEQPLYETNLSGL
jgi:hypothetical protein